MRQELDFSCAPPQARHYTGLADCLETVRVFNGILDRLGFDCRATEVQGAGQIEVRAISSRPALEAILFGPLAELRYWVRVGSAPAGAEELRNFAFDVRPHPWCYFPLFLVPLALILGFESGLRGWLYRLEGNVGIAIVPLPILFTVLLLLFNGFILWHGILVESRVAQRLMRGLQQSGIHLSATPRKRLHPTTLWNGALFVSLALAFGWIAYQESSLLAAFAALLVVFGSVVFLLHHNNPVVSMRAVAAEPGVLVPTFIFFSFFPSFILYFFSGKGILRGLKASVDILTAQEELTWSDWSFFWATVPMTATILITLAGAVALWATVFRIMLKLGLSQESRLRRLRHRRSSGLYKQALTSWQPRVAVRLMTIFLWLTLIPLTFAALVVTAAGGLQAAFEPVGLLSRQPVELSIVLAHLMLAQPLDGGTIETAVRAVWIAAGLWAIAIPVCSVGHMGLRSHALVKWLEENRIAPGEFRGRHGRSFQTLKKRMGVAEAELSIVPEQVPMAFSHTMGIFRRRSWVHLSSATLELFNRRQIEIVMAHELAHIRSADTSLERALRWLGRIALLGDGLSRTLLNSYKLERRADDAVLALGYGRAEIEAMRRKLAYYPDAVQAPLGPRLRRWEGLLSWLEGAEPRGGLRSLAIFLRLRCAMRFYRRQYFVPSGLFYWHPPIASQFSFSDDLGAEGTWESYEQERAAVGA